MSAPPGLFATLAGLGPLPVPAQPDPDPADLDLLESLGIPRAAEPTALLERIALARSIEGAAGSWRVLALGAAEPAAMEAARRAALRQGLEPAVDAREQAAAAALPGLLEGAARWDLVRVGLRGLVVPLLALPALALRIRILALATQNRGEEARGVAVLAEAGWQLRGEAPAALSRADPRRAAKPGLQLWQAPGA